jgi:phosphoribosyl-ATP pyrophosphohydrolase/phosphoribosyl-AMP cyclohydrolase
MAEKLLPVIVQDVRTNNVLMVAYANRQALERTRRTGKMHFWSRSRKRLWKKGETSGNELRVVSMHRDCDRDAILARVEPTGPACHKGTYSCFSRKPFRGGIYEELRNVVSERRRRPKPGSYTTKLLKDSERRMKKFLEESTELVLASVRKRKKEIVTEAADVLYHWFVVLEGAGVRLEDVERELEGRVRHRSRK